MASAKFNLRNPSSNQNTPIVLVFRYEGNRIKLSTGEKIHPDDWNDNKQNVRKSFIGSVEINANLERKKELINRLYRESKLKGIAPTIDYLRQAYNKADEIETEFDFFQFIEDFIEKQKPQKAKRTIISYVATQKMLLEFQKWRKAKITFEAIDMDFYDEFVNYLIEVKQYAKNTVGSFIKELKVFMNEATERGINKNLVFRSRKFKTLEEDIETIYLNEDEITTLYGMDLSTNHKLDKVRDLFVFACYTGLRISDLRRLTKTNLKENYIQIKTKKTGENVYIPYHDTVREIIAKYDGEIPPIISEQKYNDYLKELGELAGLDEPINTSRTKAGKVVTETQPKYSLITSHTARRSFATNAYKNDVPVIAIMKITGHKTERSFMKYIKISKEESAEQLTNHPFFRKSGTR